MYEATRRGGASARHITAAWLAVAVTAATGLLWGAPPAKTPLRIFINGVDTAGLAGHTGRTFKNVTATFDVAGNVYLEVPGFKVVGAPDGATGSPAATSTTPSAADVARVPVRFYILAENPRPGYSGYDIEIWINGTYIGIVRNEDAEMAVDVHAHIRKGAKNTLKFRATKHAPKKRRSASKADFIKVVLVEGRKVGASVLPENRLFEYSRTAADTASSTTEYEVKLVRH